MKSILLTLILATVAVGCGGGTKSSAPGTPGNSTPPPATSNLVGSWVGHITGTNFSGTPPTFVLLICYYDGSGTCVATSGQQVFVESSNIDVDCGGHAAGGFTGPLTVNGTQFSGTGSGSSTQVPGGWTISINGTQTGAGTGSTISGNISFSSGVCGSAANPWTGTFTATWQHG